MLGCDMADQILMCDPPHWETKAFLKGMRRSLRIQVIEKFSDVPFWFDERIAEAEYDELIGLAARILHAQTLPDLFQDAAVVSQNQMGWNMKKVPHEPALRTMSRIRELSADEETRRLAFVRERALRDEVPFLNDAKREGEQLGIEKMRQEIWQEAEERILENKRNATRKLIALTEMNDQLIAEIKELPVEEVEKLRAETQH
ncbi:hypothetical protein DU506_20295 [Vreelandella rituensis]|uniref:Rpn family recombination-promoting nuclease/putative transposase n=2 Tax=Vreelandella rituensis TaxID=2282306 RepID=A0A368TMM1_9GAMM|nr:hypothetical protein DU506_20295 [Halomonas rituensis]